LPFKDAGKLLHGLADAIGMMEAFTEGTLQEISEAVPLVAILRALGPE